MTLRYSMVVGDEAVHLTVLLHLGKERTLNAKSVMSVNERY